jgi:hypothetical protein
MSNRLNDLTAFEESMAERTVGMSLGSLEDETAPKVGLLGALAWVHVKREEPTLTYEAYMKRVSASDITTYLFGDVDGEAGFPDAGGPADGAGDVEGEVLPGDGDSPE